MLADVICNWKIASFMALDGVTLFLRLNDFVNTRKVVRCSLSIYWREFFSAMAESWKRLNTSNVFSSFIVC